MFLQADLPSCSFRQLPFVSASLRGASSGCVNFKCQDGDIWNQKTFIAFFVKADLLYLSVVCMLQTMVKHKSRLEREREAALASNMGRTNKANAPSTTAASGNVRTSRTPYSKYLPSLRTLIYSSVSPISILYIGNFKKKDLLETESMIVEVQAQRASAVSMQYSVVNLPAEKATIELAS